MKNNQFAIINVSHHQKVAELSQIGFLNEHAVTLDAKSLYRHLLTRAFPIVAKGELPTEQWSQLLATPSQSLLEFLAGPEAITPKVFYLIALQLLKFENDLDFNLTDPLNAFATIQLPTITATEWTAATVIDAWYLLLCTHTKSGQTYLDQLTAEGFLHDLEELPVTEKPVFFNGKAQAVFSAPHLIREVVYVEAPLDTDGDGQADRLKVEILRPGDTNAGLKVPALYTASPYNQGTNDEWGTQRTHSVNQPLQHKAAESDQSPEPPFNDHFTMTTPENESRFATETFSREASYTLNDYFAVRGFAVVYAAGIGTKDSDGLQTCGSPEQTVATIAVIEWLAGNRTAFTTRRGTTSIAAWWCNGNIAMTGRSYLGTLATAAATTGVSGLKTIISEAAISSWYDYYRENGLVMAPGGFQGEDADVLAAETFSRTKNLADYTKVQDLFDHYLAEMSAKMDRVTGNYNAFWAARNYRPNIANIKADILMVHGLNDWNVKPNQVKTLWDELAKLPVQRKLILHQGEHIYINAFRSFDYTDLINLWLSNKLWNVDNHANELPNVIVQDNVVPETWTGHAGWEKPVERSFNLATDFNSEQTAQFSNQFTADQFDQFKHAPAKWQTYLVTEPNQNSLRYTRPIVAEDWLLRGTPRLSVEIASSVNHGMLSAQLIDLGSERRFNVTPSILARKGIQLGYHWREDDLREFKLSNHLTKFKLISFGHINLQNRTSPAHVDDLNAGESVTVSFELQPIFHHLKAGHQLELLIFSTDFSMTQLDNEVITYTLDPTKSTLVIPSLTPYPTGVSI